MTSVNRLAGTVLLVLMSSLAAAQSQEPAEVMLLGVFHFANPGLDVVKIGHVNVMTDENQAYLESLANRLSEFDPTVVLLEYSPVRQAEIEARYQRYLDDDFELPANEIYQIGFRVAALSGADTVHGFDEQQVHWKAEPLFEYMETTDTDTGERMSATIERITKEEAAAHETMSLAALLARANDPELDAANRSLYLMTNHVGDGDNFVGADAAASWWHRNFRMYASVQRHAQPGERVLVVAGQGHTAILRQLLADDPDRKAVDVRPYLQSSGPGRH